MAKIPLLEDVPCEAELRDGEKILFIKVGADEEKKYSLAYITQGALWMLQKPPTMVSMPGLVTVLRSGPLPPKEEASTLELWVVYTQKPSQILAETQLPAKAETPLKAT